MVSSFFGLYSAQRALSTSQTVLNVISNNIANANTPGYSRQSVGLVTGSPYPQPIVGVAGLPGTFSTGVEIESITRTRDSFLDAQYRLENCTLGYYTEKQYAMQSTEGILMEPSTSGITAKLDSFFNSAQELSLHPESLPVRTSFVQQAIDLAVVFNQQASSLQSLRTALVGDSNNPVTVPQSRLGMDVVEINSKLSTLADVNKQIITLMGNNVKPNDLLDKRDKILDELNEYLPITVSETSVGSVNVSLGANLLVSGGTVVNNLQAVAALPPSNDNPAVINLVDPTTGVINVPDIGATITSGRIGGLLEMGGHDPAKLTIRGLMDNLDNLANTLATAMNTLQGTGQYITAAGTLATTAATTWDTIFGGGPPITAANITVNQDIIDDPNRVAAALAISLPTEVGDGGQALLMAQARNQANVLLGGATFSGYQSSTISTLGIQTKSNDDKLESQQTLLSQIDLRREAAAGVNMDEELVDLIRFQRAFEASSRVMSTINSILETFINRMQ